MRKQLIGMSLIVVSLTIAILIYIYFFKVNEHQTKAIQAIPDDAVLILNSDEFNTSLKSVLKQNFMKLYENQQEIEAYLGNYKFIDSLLSLSGLTSSWFENCNIAISLHSFDNGTVSVLTAIRTGHVKSNTELFNLIQNYFPNRFKMSKRRFAGSNIFDFTDFKGESNFSIAFQQGLLLFSFDGLMVEQGLIKLQSQIQRNKSIEKLSFLGLENSGLKVYVNYESLSKLLSCMTILEKNIGFKMLSNFASLGVFNISTSENSIHFKGATVTNDSLFQGLDILYGLVSMKQEVRNIMPENTNYYFSTSFDTYRSYYLNLKEYLNTQGKLKSYTDYVDSLDYVYKIRISDRFSSVISNEIALANIDIAGTEIDSSYVVIVKTDNQSSMESLLNEYQLAFNSSTVQDSVNNEVSEPDVKNFYLGDVFKVFFGPMYEGKYCKYYTNIGPYYLFAASQKVLNTFVLRNTSKALLKNQQLYSGLISKMYEKSNYEYFFDTDILMKLSQDNAKSDVYGFLSQNKGYLRKSKFVISQFVSGSDRTFLGHTALAFDISGSDETKLMWELDLDSAIAIKPHIVYNSQKAENSIFVQDLKNNIYLVDKTGMILWKSEIDGKIIGDVHQIDAFGNGNTQFLFNTSKQIYLIDDAGKLIQGYPLWIPTGTSYPVLITDIYNDKNLQIFASGSFYKLSAFDIRGRLIKNWNPKNVWPGVKSEMSYFKLGTEDIYYNLNEFGKLDFWNFAGKRVSSISIDSTIFIRRVQHISRDTGHVRFFVLDSMSTINVIDYYSNMSKSVKSIKLSNVNDFVLSPNSSMGNEFLIFISENRPGIINSDGKLLYFKVIGSQKLKNFALNYLDKGLSVSYYNEVDQKIHFDKMEGTSESTIPLKGCELYSIGTLYQDADTYLISGDSSNKLLLYIIK